MSVSPRVWLSTFVALVFMIGVSAGVLIDRTWLHEGPRRDFVRGDGRGGDGRGGNGRTGDGRGGRGGPIGRGPAGPLGPIGPPPERFVADLARDLSLTDLQRERILAAITAARPAIQKLQEESRTRFLEQQRLLDDKIIAELTADQVERYRDIVARQRSGRRGR